MANVDFPRGFVPIRRQDGDEMAFEENLVSPTSEEIGLYDLLERRADGFIHQAQNGTTTLIGVSGQHIKANPGAGTKILYSPLTELVMVAQVDDAGISAQTDLIDSFDITVTTPDPLTGQSRMELNGASKAASATLPIKILKVVELPVSSQNVLGANVAVECLVNTGVFKGAGQIG